MNCHSLWEFYRGVQRLRQKWLNRRTRGKITVPAFPSADRLPSYLPIDQRRTVVRNWPLQGELSWEDSDWVSPTFFPDS